MTITSTTSRAQYTGNGSTVNWAFNFIIPSAAELQVTLIDNSDEIGPVMTVLAPTLYQATGLGNPAGGSIKYPIAGAGISSDFELRIDRIVPYTQDTDLTNQDNFYPEVLESALDRIVMQVQQLNTLVGGVSTIEEMVSIAVAAAAIAQSGAGVSGVPYVGTDVGGTNNDIVVATTTPIGYSPSFGTRLTFEVAATNTGAATLAVAALGSAPILRRTALGPVPLLGGELVAGNIVDVSYNGTSYQIMSPVESGFKVGMSINWTGLEADIPVGWLPEYGQEISRITYAAYFDVVGVTYGAGNGSTTFNVRDKRCRADIGLDGGSSASGRVTTAGSGINATLLAAVGGAQSVILATNQIPPHTHTRPASQIISRDGGGASFRALVSDDNTTPTGSTGGGLAHTNMPPVIVSIPIVYVGV